MQAPTTLLHIRTSTCACICTPTPPHHHHHHLAPPHRRMEGGKGWRGGEGCAAGLQDSLQRTSHDLRRRRRRSASSPSRPGSGCPGSSAVTSTKSSSSRRSVPSTTATLATMAAPGPPTAIHMDFGVGDCVGASVVVPVDGLFARGAPDTPRADMTSRARRSMDHADMRAPFTEITLDLATDELLMCRRLPQITILITVSIYRSSTARIQ